MLKIKDMYRSSAKIKEFLDKEKEKRKILLDKARQGDQTAIKILQKRYKLRILSKEQYLLEKEREKLFDRARELKIPSELFSCVSLKVLENLVVRGRAWKEIVEEFEKSLREPGKLFLNGIRKLSFIEKYSREGTGAILNYLLKGDKKKMIDILTQVLILLNPWKKKDDEIRYWRKFLGEFDEEELCKLVFYLFWHTGLISRSFSGAFWGKRVKGTLRTLLASGIKEISNISNRRYVVKIIAEGKFKRKRKIPRIKIKVRSRNKKGEKKFFLGKYKGNVIEGRVCKDGAPIGSELTLSQLRFVKYYGWIFKSLEDGKLYFVKGEKGKEFILYNFKLNQPIKDYIKSGDKVPIFPIRKKLEKDAVFFIGRVDRKRLEVKLRSCCTIGDIIEMRPVRRKNEWILEFYKLGSKKKKLRSYKLRREFPYLRRIN